MAAVLMLKLGPAPAVTLALSPSGMAAPPQPLPLMAQDAGPQVGAAQLKAPGAVRSMDTTTLWPTSRELLGVPVKLKVGGAGSVTWAAGRGGRGPGWRTGSGVRGVKGGGEQLDERCGVHAF